MTPAVETRPNPSREHEDRVEILAVLADLTGHVTAMPAALPDGRRPDVLRVNVQANSLFVGDAKASEGPEDRSSQARLAGYMTWVAAQVERGGLVVVSIACGTLAEAGGWGATLEELALENDLTGSAESERLAPRLSVTWVRLGARPRPVTAADIRV